MPKKTIVFLVNVDYFFISHRLPLAKEAVKQGYSVYVLGQNTGGFKVIENEGITCLNLPIGRGHGNGINDFLVLFKLCHILFRLKPEILHNITVKPIIYGSLAAGFSSRNTKVVNAVTGLGYAFVSKKASFTRVFMLFLLKMGSFFSPKKTFYIFQNADDQAIYFSHGLSNGENSVLIRGAGVDEAYFLRTTKTMVSGKVRITLVSRMLRDKGVLDFAQAAEILYAKLQGKVEFVLVGGLDYDNPRGISKEELEAVLIPDYLIWEGHRSDIREVYNSSDIACLPSYYREGLPKSLIEAMAMSCPIITTDAPGCRECVDEGINGYLVPPRSPEILADRLLRLIEQPEIRKRMGEASRVKMLKDMSLSTVIAQTFALYEA